MGGVYYTIRGEDQPGPAFTPNSKAYQREALQFFNTQLFKTPYWLMNSAVLDKVNMPVEPNFVEDMQVRVRNSLLDMGGINKLIANMKQFGKQAYPVDEYITTIHRDIWQELRNSGEVKMDSYRRNLQKTYWGAIFDMLSTSSAANMETDVSSLLKADISLLQGQIKQAIPRVQDPLTLYHLKDLLSRIKSAMETKKPI